MSYGPDDLIGDLQNYNRVITGFRGTHHFDVFVGTLKWHREDDQGRIYNFSIYK